MKIKLKAYTILINRIILLFTLFLSVSCSTYITYLEKEEVSHIHEIPKEETPLYCPIKSRPKYNIIHESQFGIEEFTHILNSLDRSSSKLNITELALLYTLYNSVVRPDATNWNSRLQFYINQGKNQYYYDFHDDELNFEKAIQTFKQLKISNVSAENLKSLALRYFPRKLTVQKKFSSYLEKYSDKLHPQHKKKYFRLGKALQKGETFTAQLSGLSLTKKKFKAKSKAPLFSISNSKSSQCNFDSKLYDSGIFIIHNEDLNENVFGIIQDNGDFAMIASSTGGIIQANAKLTQSSFSVPKFNIPLCHYKDANREIINISYASRDSGQLLHHLNQYQYFNSSSYEELIQYTSYARHLFLTNPPRMLYETKRGTPQELNNFLALNFPVYHAKSIGIIHSIAKFNNGPFSFIEDERGNTYQSCLDSK